MVGTAWAPNGPRPRSYESGEAGSVHTCMLFYSFEGVPTLIVGRNFMYILFTSRMSYRMLLGLYDSHGRVASRHA